MTSETSRERFIDVRHFERLPFDQHHSIERVFSDLRAAMPSDIRCRAQVCRLKSSGLWRRLYIMAAAFFQQGRINHVTGDVHFLAILLRKRHTVLTIHDSAALHRLTGWRQTLLRHLWFQIPARRAGLVTVVSEFTKEDLLRHVSIDERKIRVIPNCVSPDFTPHPKPWPTSPPVLLQVGTGTNKNLLRLAEALRGVECQVRIVGPLSGLQRAALRDCGIAYENVEDLSPAGVLQEYRGCDVVVFPSTYEGFGLPIIEANATGRPVVTSALPPMREVAGDAACLVDPLDVASIREGILRVLMEPAYREELVANGFKNILRYSAHACAARYADCYRELAFPLA